MPYLSFIDDTDLEGHVTTLLKVALGAKQKAEREFSRNVIDPFSPIFEMSGFGTNHETWKYSELQRQAQKTLSNSLGDFHQAILGSLEGWVDLGVGGQVDLKNDTLKIIAEVKNKHNTVTGGKLAGIYKELDNLISPKASGYKGYTAYFVNIIPKKPTCLDKPFTPSDKERGAPCPTNENIRIIDGASFFDKATGVKGALKMLHTVLPQVVEKVIKDEKVHSPGWSGFSDTDRQFLAKYFKDAYGQ